MSSGLIYLTLCALVVTTALNLWLVVRLAQKVELIDQSDTPELTLPAGSRLPTIAAHLANDPQVDISLNDIQNAFVILFLSDGCPSCKEVAEEVSEHHSFFQSSNVGLWIMTLRAAPVIRKRLEERGLGRNIIDVSPESLKLLNPKSASPFYIFVNAENVIEAGDFVGDENWNSFVAQIKDEAESQLNI
ncbi:redoxin domain-containing protein [Hellea sp.]|nr:redoxin domain-containing protein [Hellea sp.]